MTGNDLLGYISNFWSHQFEDHDIVESLFDGYIDIVRAYYIVLHRMGLTHSVQYHPGCNAIIWERFDFSDRATSYSLGQNYLSIPTFQNTYKDPSMVLVEGTDYTLENGVLTFLTVDVPGQKLWAPIIYKNDQTVWDNFGSHAGLDSGSLYGITDTRDVLRVLRAVWYSYKSGPSIYNIKVGANALSGYPFSDYAGKVTSITDTDHSRRILRVSWGDTGSGFVGANGDAFIFGKSLGTSSTGITDMSGGWLFDSDMFGVLIGDYVSINTSGSLADVKVATTWDVTEGEIKSISYTGTLDSECYTITDTDSDDFAGVYPGDLAHVTGPVLKAGYYRIKKVDGDTITLDSWIGSGSDSISYTIIRMPGVKLEKTVSVNKTGLSWRGISTLRDWPLDAWAGQYLIDSSDRKFLINRNSESVLFLNKPEDGTTYTSWPFNGSVTIAPPNEATRYKDYLLDAAVIPVFSVGGFVRRFAPLTDGVVVSDWRSSSRFKRYKRPSFVLSENSDGSDVLTINSTAGIVKNDYFKIIDNANTALEFYVVDVPSETTIQVSRDIPAVYTTTDFARLLPSKLDVDGLSGFSIVTYVSNTGATDNVDGTIFLDDNATFVTDNVLSGDTIRIIGTNGDVELAHITSIQSETQVTLKEDLGADRDSIYYNIVSDYIGKDYLRATLTLTEIGPSSNEVPIRSFFKKNKPGWVDIIIAPLIQEVYDSTSVVESLPIFWDYVIDDAETGGSETGGNDITGSTFLTGRSGAENTTEDATVWFEDRVDEEVAHYSSLTGEADLTGNTFVTGSETSIDDYAYIFSFTNLTADTVSIPTESSISVNFTADEVEPSGSDTGGDEVTGPDSFLTAYGNILKAEEGTFSFIMSTDSEEDQTTTDEESMVILSDASEGSSSAEGSTFFFSLLESESDVTTSENNVLSTLVETFSESSTTITEGEEYPGSLTGGSDLTGGHDLDATDGFLAVEPFYEYKLTVV